MSAPDAARTLRGALPLAGQARDGAPRVLAHIGSAYYVVTSTSLSTSYIGCTFANVARTREGIRLRAWLIEARREAP